MKPVVAEVAKSNMSAGGGDKKSEKASSGLQTFANPIHTDSIVAKEAGVSRETVRKVETILKGGNQQLIDKLAGQRSKARQSKPV